MMNRYAQRTLLIGCIAALVWACAPAATTTAPRSQPPPPTTPSPATTAAPSAASTLTVGIIVPFTESAINSDFGVAQQRAADLYLQQKGGMLAGRPVKLVYSDEAITGDLDTVKATQLVGSEHAEVLLGLIGTDGAYAVRNYADANKVVFIDTNASGNALTRTEVGCTPSCKSRYLFRSSYSSWQLAEPLGAWAASNGAKAFDVVTADGTFGIESAAAFLEGLASAGGAATRQTKVQPGEDWAKVIAGIAAQPTKNVFAAFSGTDAISFITAWDQAQLAGKGYKLFGPGPLADVDVLAQVKGAAAGVTTASFWASSLDRPEDKAFRDLFAKAYQDETGTPAVADGYAVEMWDAMTALDMALQKTDASAASDALITALEGVSFTSPRGAFAFDQGTHNVVQDIYIRQVRVTGVAASNVVVETIPKVVDPGR